MQLQPFVEQVRIQFGTAAALGDETTRQTAEALAAATEPAVRLALIGASTAVADEVTAALLDVAGTPEVTVRVDGDDLRIDVRAASDRPDTPNPPAVPSTEDAAGARISLRLPESVKTGVESAARADGVSVNTWLIRAAMNAMTQPAPRRPGGDIREQRGSRGSHSITGWVNG